MCRFWDAVSVGSWSGSYPAFGSDSVALVVSVSEVCSVDESAGSASAVALVLSSPISISPVSNFSLFLFDFLSFFLDFLSLSFLRFFSFFRFFLFGGFENVSPFFNLRLPPITPDTTWLIFTRRRWIDTRSYIYTASWSVQTIRVGFRCTQMKSWNACCPAWFAATWKHFWSGEKKKNGRFLVKKAVCPSSVRGPVLGWRWRPIALVYHKQVHLCFVFLFTTWHT